MKMIVKRKPIKSWKLDMNNKFFKRSLFFEYGTHKGNQDGNARIVGSCADLCPNR